MQSNLEMSDAFELQRVVGLLPALTLNKLALNEKYLLKKDMDGDGIL